MRWALLIWLALMSGCFSLAEPTPCTLACGPAGQCPRGRLCLQDGYCHPPGELACVDGGLPRDLGPSATLTIDIESVDGATGTVELVPPGYGCGQGCWRYPV